MILLTDLYRLINDYANARELYTIISTLSLKECKYSINIYRSTPTKDIEADFKECPINNIRTMSIFDMSPVKNRILSLTIEHCNSYLIPNFDLPYLRTLTITHSNHVDEIPDFQYLPRLRFLDLNYNRLEDIPNFSYLPLLTYLCISNNDFEDFPVLSNLKSLKELECSADEIDSNVPYVDILFKVNGTLRYGCNHIDGDELTYLANMLEQKIFAEYGNCDVVCIVEYDKFNDGNTTCIKQITDIEKYVNKFRQLSRYGYIHISNILKNTTVQKVMEWIK